MTSILWGWIYIAFRVVFQEIYAADKEIYATPGPTGPAKYQLCPPPSYVQLKKSRPLIMNFDNFFFLPFLTIFGCLSAEASLGEISSDLYRPW